MLLEGLSLSDIYIYDWLILLIGVTVVFLSGYFFRKYMIKSKLGRAEEVAKKITMQAEKEASTHRKELELEAKDLLYKTKANFERETRQTREELKEQEKKISQKEENIDRKVEILEKKEAEINELAKKVDRKGQLIKDKEEELSGLIEREKRTLQQISGLDRERAKQMLLKKMESDVRHEAEKLIKQIEDEAREKGEKKAKNILSLVIQKCAVEHTVETTVSAVNLPNDEMKGRIIGREGRNIRSLEKCTGIDVIVDDTPEAVTLSGFDIVRREIAKVALERLVQDGRIHPARIEEVVSKVEKEMEKKIKEEGEQVALDLNVQGLNPEIIKLLGRLKYRTSYGQNVLQHSKEVAYLMGVMASELGEDFNLARRIGLLHDIGKAVDHEVEGTHAQIGANMAKKYGESEKVIRAISTHHEDIEARNILEVLIQAADAISSSRPGARRETLETYVKRLENLESIADSFKEVEKGYAIQAGREIRVIVKPSSISDSGTKTLARKIKNEVEKELEYPGQIKITVIRETRTVDYAK